MNEVDKVEEQCLNQCFFPNSCSFELTHKASSAFGFTKDDVAFQMDLSGKTTLIDIRLSKCISLSHKKSSKHCSRLHPAFSVLSTDTYTVMV
jgi:hypothetical protein